MSFFEKLKLNKKLQFLLVALLLVLLLFFMFFSASKEKESSINDNQITIYVSDLENRLTNTLKRVEGAGDVSVVITVESGMETVLATKTVTKETVNGVETESSPIIINGKTVVVKELYPKVVGVLIVAQGANNFNVLARIQQATMSLLNIDLNQIEILTMR
ncbi:MAG: hypothetical protein J6C62_00420 [Clostridia bacterium]|nr:hypothetical protein [Clostridia bacterium]